MKCDLPSYVSSVGFSDDKNLPSAKRKRERETNLIIIILKVKINFSRILFNSSLKENM